METHEARKKEIEIEFKKFDKDGNGVVTLVEAHAILQDKLGLTSKGTWKMLEACDQNGDGQLSYEEFCEFYFAINNKVAEMKAWFREFDKDGSGSVSTKEACDYLRNLGFPEWKVKRLIHEYDTNEDGELQYEEFLKFWNAD